jgi:hypothetical protein
MPVRQGSLLVENHLRQLIRSNSDTTSGREKKKDVDLNRGKTNRKNLFFKQSKQEDFTAAARQS